ncbi:MAG: galactose oxidase [Bacteroidota bacterium]|nr:galactose oxidase [Bacteroidota bacterium]
MRNSLWILFFVSIAFAFSSCSSSSSSSLVGNWTRVAPFPLYARSGAVSFTIGNYAYVGLGYNTSESNRYFNDFYKYNPTTNAWTKVATFPGSGRVKAVAFVVGDTAYVGTGYKYDNTTGIKNYFADFYKLVPSGDTGKWVQIKDFAGGRRSSAVAFAVGGKGYVGTGTYYDGIGTVTTNDFYQYDPKTGTWSTNADINFSSGMKRSDAVTFVINDKAYIVSGYNQGSAEYAFDFFKFDPTLTGNKWVQLRNVKNTSSDSYDDDYSDITRYKAVGFASSTKGYLTLGYLGSTLGTTWEYDPTTDLWSKKTSFEGASRTDAVGLSVSGRLFISTGAQGSNFLDDTWELKPNQEYDENN